MPVLKDYKCPSCGFFESFYPICPRCGNDEVLVVYMKGPGIKSGRTKLVDENTAQFVQASGMTNYSNNVSTMHANDRREVWQPYNPKTLNKELAAIQAHTSINLAASKPNLGGRFDAAYHADDLKDKK